MSHLCTFICECCEIACKSFLGSLFIGLMSVGVLWLLMVVLSQFGVIFPWGL